MKMLARMKKKLFNSIAGLYLKPMNRIRKTLQDERGITFTEYAFLLVLIVVVIIVAVVAFRDELQAMWNEINAAMSTR